MEKIEKQNDICPKCYELLNKEGECKKCLEKSNKRIGKVR